MKISLLFVGLMGMTMGALSQTSLLFEDFNAGMPSGWGIFNEDGLTPDVSLSHINDAWVIAEDTDSTGMADSCVISTSYYDPAGQSDDWLVLPAVTLGSNGNYLFWDAKSEDPAFPDSYEIWVNTTGGNVSDFTDSAFFKVDNENPYWQSHAIPLDSFVNETVYIAFRNVSDDQFILFLDNIHITEFDPLNVDMASESRVKLYPNPVVDNLTIEGLENGASYMVFDNAGRQVAFGTVSSNSINLEGLPKGHYTIGLTSPGRLTTFKQIIKN